VVGEHLVDDVSCAHSPAEAEAREVLAAAPSGVPDSAAAAFLARWNVEELADRVYRLR